MSKRLTRKQLEYAVAQLTQELQQAHDQIIMERKIHAIMLANNPVPDAGRMPDRQRESPLPVDTSHDGD